VCFYGHDQRFSLKTPLSHSLHLNTKHVNLQCASSLSKVKSYNIMKRESVREAPEVLKSTQNRVAKVTGVSER
jgi:hypothetical protein